MLPKFLPTLRRARGVFLRGTAALFLLPGTLSAGQFSLDWSKYDWPAGALGPRVIGITDGNGYRLDATISVSGGPIGVSPVPITPDDLALFGGAVESFVIIGDAPFQGGSIGESTVSTTISFAVGGVPYPVDGLTYLVEDIDASDNNDFQDRCDFVTVTGDTGNPVLTSETATPTFVIGPGPGSGNTGPIAANQAQCIFVTGIGPSPTSNDDKNGSLRATHPNGTTTATIAYDESISNVVGFRADENPYARGTSMWSALFFTSTQAISLDASASTLLAGPGDTVTYSYVITNDGDLAFNTGQTITINDSRLGLLSCPAITAQVQPGETFTCTGTTTVSAGDVLAGSIDSTATAGIGPAGQSFALRLQSNTEALSVAVYDSIGRDYGDAPLTYLSPVHNIWPAAGIYLGTVAPDAEPSMQSGPTATGDDVAGADDEDAIAFPTLEAGTTETLSVRVTGPGLLQGWIDFNGNGIFEALLSERIATDLRDDGTGDDLVPGDGVIQIAVDVPPGAANTVTYARLRFSSVASLGIDGFAVDGEVEDYRVTISSPAGPLSCDAGFYMVANQSGTDLPNLTRLTVTEDAGVYSMNQSQLPPDYTGNYLVTGWGYNELDGYIYGVRQSPRSLMRIDSNGAVTEVADLSGLTIESPDTAADILPNGIMVYMSGTNNSLYQLLDISDPENPVALGVLDAGAGAPYARDFAYNPQDGLLYFFDPARNLYALDPKGGTPGATTVTLVTPNVPLPAGYFAIDLDSVWFDADGFLYAFDNQSRQVFALEVGRDGNRPASWDFIEIDGTVTGITYQGNDGASCRAPGPFTPTVAQLGAISGTLYLDVNLSGTLDAGDLPMGAGLEVQLFDENGTPGDTSDDIAVGSTDTAIDGTYSFDLLDPLATYRIAFVTIDPDLPAGLGVVTANPLTSVPVTGGATTTSQDFGFAPTAADLSIAKAALAAADGQPIASAPAGTAIDWVLTVANDGPAAASGVQVRDLLPDGYAYVSDDAAAQGGSYDVSTGVWVPGTIASGTSETLTIRVIMLAQGNHLNSAEIIASGAEDPDSDPGVGAATDDLGDGLPDDDEASATVTLETGGQTIAGRVFLDNGAGGGTAHDGLLNGTEAGTAQATVSIYDDAMALLASPVVAADGSWAHALPEGYAGTLTIVTSALPGWTVVSETAQALPGLVNPDPLDGALTFSPAAGIDYTGLDTGLIREATLTEGQTAGIEAGQVVLLHHVYAADSSGTVSFALADVTQAPSGAFAAALFLDADCDGTPDTVLADPVAVAAGTQLCLVVRVAANGGIGTGSAYAFDLTAATAYDGIPLSETDRNTDRLAGADGQGKLDLAKTVRNVTQGSVEGASNTGNLGDVLEYRIYLSNPSSATASDVIIYDQTPAYTALAEPVPSPVAVGPAMTCVLAAPAANLAGYAGALRWECSGSYAPGDQGAVSFRVEIRP